MAQWSGFAWPRLHRSFLQEKTQETKREERKKGGKKEKETKRREGERREREGRERREEREKKLYRFCILFCFLNHTFDFVFGKATLVGRNGDLLRLS